MERFFIGNTVMTASDTTTDITDIISIAKQYTKYPGPRYIHQGSYSGEDFFNRLLRPKFQEVLVKGGVLLVDLDGTVGYPSSFLEESFGALVRNFDIQLVQNHIKIKTDEEPYLLEEIMAMMSRAKE